MLAGPTPEKIRDPNTIRFTHETIADALSKPKPGEKTCPHLDNLVREIKEGRQQVLDFPPIHIFSIRDPETDEKNYYSLNNRKLYVAKKSRAEQIRTKKADFSTIIESTWKFTSTSDGLRLPAPTRDGDREAQPTGLLHQWRQFIETRLPLYRANTPKDASETAEERLYREAVETFNLKCRR